MKSLLIWFVFFLSINCFGQDKIILENKESKTALYLLDSVEISKEELGNKINSDEISDVHIFKYEYPQFRKYGDKAKNGIFVITTKSAHRKIYQKFLSGKSKKFKNLILKDSLNNNIQFFINDEPIVDGFEKPLSKIDNNNFISLKVINKSRLIKEYKIFNKDYGVLVKTKLTEYFQ